MNVMRHILFITGAIFAMLAASCINDDITTSPSATLSFSKDTVNFGTVFTDLGSPTARLVVFNHNNKGVNISSIRFRNPDGPFKFNVDGVSGSEFKDVEIRGRDSIYVFIECYLDANDTKEPFRIADQLEFVTNGVQQEVEVEAWGWNVTRLKGETVSTALTLTAERPYIIFDSLVVAPKARLQIEPGAMVLFHDGAELMVRGTLHAEGEVGNMIQMRGDRLDDVLPDIGYDILAGQWKGVRIASESFDNFMSFVDMRSTEEGLRVDSCGDLTRQKLTLMNSWLHNSRETALVSEYAKVDAFGCVFSDAAAAVVRLIGGEHLFSQCTIANYYLFSSFGEPNLSLYHCLPDKDEIDQPLMKASFENGILWGLIGEPINIGDLTGSDVYLRNMLIKADGTDDDNFIDCVWNEDPLFETIREDYYFNYRLQPDSPAFGRGNPEFVYPICETDMDGLFRLADGLPTLGAYCE